MILASRSIHFVFGLVPANDLSTSQMDKSRRSFIQTTAMAPIITGLFPTMSARAEVPTTTDRPFESNAFPKAELTNSIIASRDTNVSPMEVYDTLRSQLRKNSNTDGARALDVGAGAGVSTQVLYQQLGYKTIDAIDWSGVAWQANVVESGYCPSTVHFYELDDERFVKEWRNQGSQRYDVIVFNFAVNKDKALYFCRNLLKPDGLLLAPINTQKDYWLKQSYQLLDAEGRVAWSANDVGAWTVLFQPDVTQDTCQGIWCAPFNGFQKLRLYN